MLTGDRKWKIIYHTFNDFRRLKDMVVHQNYHLSPMLILNKVDAFKSF